AQSGIASFIVELQVVEDPAPSCVVEKRPTLRPVRVIDARVFTQPRSESRLIPTARRAARRCPARRPGSADTSSGLPDVDLAGRPASKLLGGLQAAMQEAKASSKPPAAPIATIRVDGLCSPHAFSIEMSTRLP